MRPGMAVPAWTRARARCWETEVALVTQAANTTAAETRCSHAPRPERERRGGREVGEGAVSSAFMAGIVKPGGAAHHSPKGATSRIYAGFAFRRRDQHRRGAHPGPHDTPAMGATNPRPHAWAPARRPRPLRGRGGSRGHLGPTRRAARPGRAAWRAASLRAMGHRRAVDPMPPTGTDLFVGRRQGRCGPAT